MQREGSKVEVSPRPTASDHLAADARQLGVLRRTCFLTCAPVRDMNACRDCWVRSARTRVGHSTRNGERFGAIEGLEWSAASADAARTSVACRERCVVDRFALDRSCDLGRRSVQRPARRRHQSEPEDRRDDAHGGDGDRRHRKRRDGARRDVQRVDSRRRRSMLNVGDTVIVHFQNHLDVGTGIHWHGIELANEVDGTPFTQNPVPPGGSFLYKFTVTRPGIFWYHPHHDPSDDSNTNQVFSGLYGMIVVRDPNEAALQASGTLPPRRPDEAASCSATRRCARRRARTTRSRIRPDGITLPGSATPVEGRRRRSRGRRTPRRRCCARRRPRSTAPEASAPRRTTPATSPAVQQTAEAGRTRARRCSRTVRTSAPARGAAAAPARSRRRVDTARSAPVRACASSSSIRRRSATSACTLPTTTGTQVPLIRVGGEGGLLDNAVEEGGTQGTWVTGYDSGEIVLPPGSRADVVAAIPAVRDRCADDVDRGLSADRVGLRRHPDGSGHASRPSPGHPCLPPTRSRRHTAPGGHRRPRAGPRPADRNAAQPGDVQPAEARQRLADDHLHHKEEREARSASTAPRHHMTSRTIRRPRTWSTRRGTRNPATRCSCRSRTRSQANHPFHLHGFSIQPISLSNGRTGHTDVHLAIPRVPRQRRHPGSSPRAQFHAHVPAADRSPPAARRGHARRRARPVAVPLPHLLPRDARHALRARRRPGQRQGAPRHQRQHERRSRSTRDRRRPSTAHTSTSTTSR